MKTTTFIFGLIFLMVSCNNISKSKSPKFKSQSASTMEENLYRPNYHFTPKAHWMNDPNGMFYFNGFYHLYFQYYPDGNVWGPMHWGHAKSSDLILWEEQPIALYPDSLGYIFSGGAVVDTHNTSGFGTNGKIPIVAIYTYHDMIGEKAETSTFQTQAIAYSLDEGQTFTKYSKNPVIKNPGIKDFRDPKVIWDDARKKWVMVLAAGQKIMFYSSPNLKDWELLSDFGSQIGSHDGVWECPDLFPMVVEGTDQLKWVLIVSINPGGPNGGSATQYFIGDFDGSKFSLDASFEKDLKLNTAIWLDHGRDNYAGVTWANVPENDGRKLFIGWMSNWDYARDVPTETWRGAMTIARALQLKKIKTSYRLCSTPVSELKKYVSKAIHINELIVSNNETIITNDEVNLSSSGLQLEIKDLKENKYTFFFYNKFGDSLSFGIDNVKKHYFIDRRKSGKVAFSDKFANNVSRADLTSSIDSFQMQVLLDKTSIEIFYNNGETTMTEIFFPNHPFETLSIMTSDEKALLENIRIEEFQFK